jgi:mono/diheme cytochrome c family protein
LAVEGTAAQVARGRYLFHNVSQCIECHAVHDRTKVGDPVRPHGLGKENAEEWGVEPFFPPNLTPAALGDWSDGEIIRAISSGIRKNGRALFPAMPYDSYRHMAMEDLEAVVAYLRTLEPIPVEHPRATLEFPLSLIARISPRPADSPQTAPVAGMERGRYLVDIAGCRFCHTPFEGTPPKPVAALEFAGGHEFPSGDWIVRSANITPDDETGIGRWTRERFVGRFKQAAVHPDTLRAKDPTSPPTAMPWANYAGIREEELGANYDYLRTLEARPHRVITRERLAAPQE